MTVREAPPAPDVPAHLWPARLRGCWPRSVAVGYHVAGQQWERLEPDGRNVVVR